MPLCRNWNQKSELECKNRNLGWGSRAPTIQEQWNSIMLELRIRNQKWECCMNSEIKNENHRKEKGETQIRRDV